MAELRRLTPDDRRALSRFTCRDFREPWSDLVEELISTRLADALDGGDIEGIGLWVGGTLCGVTAWAIDGSTAICDNIVLAVRTGYQRRGHGRTLKQAVIDRAREAGAEAVVSYVHFDNDPMIHINAELGANVEAIAGDPDHRYCVIPVG